MKVTLKLLTISMTALLREENQTFLSNLTNMILPEAADTRIYRRHDAFRSYVHTLMLTRIS